VALLRAAKPFKEPVLARRSFDGGEDDISSLWFERFVEEEDKELPFVTLGLLDAEGRSNPEPEEVTEEMGEEGDVDEES
jgi:hypothetical protein